MPITTFFPSGSSGGGGLPTSAGTYAPTYTAIGGPIDILSGTLANFSQVGSTVTVSFAFSTTWLSNGVGTVTVSLPPGLPFVGGPNVRGTVVSTPVPYAAVAISEAQPIVGSLGADLQINIANSVGIALGLRADVIVQYQTP